MSQDSVLAGEDVQARAWQMSVSCTLLSPGWDLPGSSVWWTWHKSIWLQRPPRCCCCCSSFTPPAPGTGERGREVSCHLVPRRTVGLREIKAGCEGWQGIKRAGEEATCCFLAEKINRTWLTCTRRLLAMSTTEDRKQIQRYSRGGVKWGEC